MSGDIIKGCVVFGCFSAVTNVGLLLYLLMIKYKIDGKKYLEQKININKNARRLR